MCVGLVFIVGLVGRVELVGLASYIICIHRGSIWESKVIRFVTIFTVIYNIKQQRCK